MIQKYVMFLQLSSYSAYSIHSSLLIFVSAASFAASLFFHIPIQKVSFLHSVLIYAGILPHLTENMDLFLPFVLIHIGILTHLL